MNAQGLINAWGRQKYPHYPQARFTLSVERGSEGYCETCWSEYSYVSVSADGTEIAELRDVELRDVELHELLNEILGSQP